MVTFYAFDAPESKQAAVEAYWGAILAFLLASFFFSLRVSEQHLSRKIVNPQSEVAFTGQNALAIMSILLDGLQLIVVLLMCIRQKIWEKIDEIVAIDSPTSDAQLEDMASLQIVSDGIETITGIAFLHIWNSPMAQLVFLTVIAAVAVLGLMILLSPLASMMIHYGRRPTREMKKANVDRALKITHSIIYKTIVTLSVTFSVSIVESLSVVLKCTKESDMDATAERPGTMVLEDGWFPDTICWSSWHALLAITAMTIISVYVTVCLTLGVYFGRTIVESDEGLDIRYSQSYQHTSTGLCASASVSLYISRVMLSSSELKICKCLMAGTKLMLIVLEKVFPAAMPFLISSVCILLLSAVHTAFFRSIHAVLAAVKKKDDAGGDEHLRDGGVEAACSIPWVSQLRLHHCHAGQTLMHVYIISVQVISLRVGVYLAAGFTALWCIIVLVNQPRLAHLIGLPVGVFVILALSCVHGFVIHRQEYRRRAQNREASIKSVRSELLSLAALIKREEAIVPGMVWLEDWTAQIKKARQPCSFAQHLLDFETSVNYFVLSGDFLLDRQRWREALRSVHINLEAVAAAVTLLKDGLDLGQELLPRNALEVPYDMFAEEATDILDLFSRNSDFCTSRIEVHLPTDFIHQRLRQQKARAETDRLRLRALLEASMLCKANDPGQPDPPVLFSRRQKRALEPRNPLLSVSEDIAGRGGGGKEAEGVAGAGAGAGGGDVEITSTCNVHITGATEQVYISSSWSPLLPGWQKQTGPSGFVFWVSSHPSLPR